MKLNFGHPLSWAVGLGLFAAALAGTVVPSPSPAREIQQVLGFFLIFTPALYLHIERRRRHWGQKHPYMRFVVFTLTMTAATVILVQAVLFLGTGAGVVAQGIEFLAGVGGFLTALWMTFYGGAERLWQAFRARTDFEW